jgi:hypothetical protein
METGTGVERNFETSIMRKSIVMMLIVLGSYSVVCRAQNDSVAFFRHYISFQISDLPKVGFRLIYENQFRRKQSFRIEAGYKPNLISYSNEWAEVVNESDGVNSYTHTNILTSVGYKFIFLQSRLGGFQWYVSGNLGYRYSFSKLLINVDGSDGYYSYDLFSTNVNRIEFRALLGQKYSPGTKHHNSVCFFEWYLGMGLYSEHNSGIYYGWSAGSDPAPVASLSMIHHSSIPEAYGFWNHKIRFCFGMMVGAA